MHDGQLSARLVIEHVDSVGIIALDEKLNLLIVKQFRQAVSKPLLEIPAGCLEPGEKPEAAALRELREETGYAAKRLEKLGGFYLAPGYATEYMHIYLARDLAYAPLTAEDTDSIELIRLPSNNLVEFISSGQIEDCKSIAALLMFINRPEN